MGANRAERNTDQRRQQHDGGERKPVNNRLTLRPACHRDAELLLAWRNDPSTREASHSTAMVQPEQHAFWMAQTLAGADRRLMIAELDGKPIGTVRADRSQGCWELSWTVAPQARGRGLAKRMVAMMALQIDEPIRAEIKTGHAASIRVAESAGMELEREHDGVLHYRRGARRTS